MTDTARTIVLVVIAVLLVFMVLPLVLGGGMMGAGYGYMGPGMMGGWFTGGGPAIGGLTSLFWLLILVGIGVLAFWGLRRVGPGEASPRRPLDILKERYARGEITREQYDQMRHDLEA